MHPGHKLIWIPGLIILAALAAVLVWGFSTSPRLYAKPELASGPDSSAGWRIGEAVSYETLTVFPVLSSQEAYTADFETLDAALASGAAIVAEQGEYMRRSRDGGESSRVISSGPQVNQLVLVNRGKKPLLLLAGEVVSGGKQDRIIGKDRLVPAGAAPLPLDVFCVEHGRWTGGSDQFVAGKTMVHPSVREKAAIEQDQSQVWAAVRSPSAGLGSASAARTGSASGVISGSAPAAAPQISADTVDMEIA